MKETYWQETVRKVGSDDWDGEHIEVGPDADGSGCVEIRYRDKDGSLTCSRITLGPPDAAILVAAAIIECVTDLRVEEARQREATES